MSVERVIGVVLAIARSPLFWAGMFVVSAPDRTSITLWHKQTTSLETGRVLAEEIGNIVMDIPDFVRPMGVLVALLAIERAM